MGKEQSKLEQEGYVISKQTDNYITATKDDETFFIKKIDLKQLSKEANGNITSEMEILKKMNHPHIVNMKNSFKDEKENIYYMVMDQCQDKNLAVEIKNESPEPTQEAEILSWIVQICMALKTIHEAALHHKDLKPENVYFTEHGILRLGGFGNILKNSKNPADPTSNEILNYLAPEVFTEGTYDSKSDMWSVGCILYELSTKEKAYSAENAVSLIPKIITGGSPSLPNNFSPDLCDLLDVLLKKDPRERPTASEILMRPIVLSYLRTKSKTTVDDLYTKLNALRALADGLERVHEGTTIGSLAGGVIGAVGGITSIVGLILAPFTLGASLIVTGVGVGVGAVGGATAGVSNITNMVNQSNDRKAVRSMIKEFEQKIKAVVTWLMEINSSLQTISSQCPQTSNTDSNLDKANLKKLGFRAGKGISGITELIRLTRVMSIGKLAAQTSRVVRAAEVATGIFAGLFVAVDIFFIAVDAKEIHHIKKAREEERRTATSTSSGSALDDSVPDFDKAKLLLNSEMEESDVTSEKNETSETNDPSAPNKTEIRSEIMKFVCSVREEADKLEKVLDELKAMISSIPSITGENDEEMLELE